MFRLGHYLRSSLGNTFEGIGANKAAEWAFSGVNPGKAIQMIKISPTAHSALGYGMVGGIPGAAIGYMLGGNPESALMGGLAGATTLGAYGLYSGNIPYTVPSWM